MNTGRSAAVVRSGHPIAKVIVLNVRDDYHFPALFINLPPSPPDPLPQPTNPPPVADSSSDETSTRRVELSDANIGQHSMDQKIQLMSAQQPKNVGGLFPEGSKRARACMVRELKIPLIDEEYAPIAVINSAYH